MSQFKKYMSILLLIPIVIVLAYFITPIKFSKSLLNSENLYVTYVDNSNGINEPINLSFNSDSDEFQAFKRILNQYTYHNCIDTLTGKSKIEGSYQTFILTIDKETMIISNVPKIIVGNKVYHIGYFGTSKILSLNDDLKVIFGIN